jgi:hypothetical protein
VKSSITGDFRRRFSGLPPTVQRQAVRAYRLWRSDPYHRSLQFKRVGRYEPLYSVRVGRSYRALELWEGDAVYWFWIGPHAEYEELLKRF